MMLGKLDIHMQNTEMLPNSLSSMKVNSKWMKYLNILSKNFKLLGENRGKTLQAMQAMIFGI
jgi:hypothetical protein